MNTQTQPPPLCPALAPDQAEATLVQIRNALQARRWEQAQQLAEAALAAGLAGPALGEAQLLLAQARWWQGQLERVHRPALRAAVLAGPPAQRVLALNIAALTLSELGLADEALPLALQSLELARRPEQHELLSRTLSCAAHVYARLGDLEHAEPLHMQALSLAREVKDPSGLQQAYGNLLLSTAMAHEELLEQQQPEAARAALLRGLHYLSHARSLLQDERLGEERHSTLRLMLGRLLMYGGRLDEAEPMLRQGIAEVEAMGGHYYLRGGRLSLAELLRRRGQPERALPLLPAPGEGDGGCLQVGELRCRLACHRMLGEQPEAERVEALLSQALARRDATRLQARRQRLGQASQFGELDPGAGGGAASMR